MTVAVERPGHGEGTPELPWRVALRFEPSGTTVRVPPGVTIFDAAAWNAIAIDSTCGGHGTCKKCKVRVAQGTAPVTPLDQRALSERDLADGWRLACRALAQDDLVVDVPALQTRPKAATVGLGRQVILRPALQKRYVELDEPALDDQRFCSAEQECAGRDRPSPPSAASGAQARRPPGRPAPGRGMQAASRRRGRVRPRPCP